MNESTLNRMIREHKEHLIWLSVFLVLAVFVTALVFGTLKRSVQAQTYTKRVFVCASAQEGAEPVAHQHNDDCYENGELICTLPERELHIHGDECYAEEKVLVCTLEESEGHVHTDACYTEEPVLVCGLEENNGHVHSVENGCYTRVQGDLICTDEDPEHVHTDDCYAWEEVLTCEIPEGEGAHHHSEECYETQLVLSCGKEEGEGAHTHDDTCYEINKVLICDKEEVKTEHVHTVDCFKVVDMSPEEIHALHLSELPESDPDADVESPDVWESRFASVPLSGEWDRDLLKIAETQLGYTESQRNFDAVLDENGEGYTLKGWTRYGAWYGIPYGDWCAMFISFCLNYADIPESAVPYDCATTTWIDSLSARGMYAPAGSYDPKPGDLIFFDWEGDGLSDHVGIVWAVNPGSITTIEGNHTPSVELFDYDLTDGHIQGYGILPENPELAATEDAENLEGGEADANPADADENENPEDVEGEATSADGTSDADAEAADTGKNSEDDAVLDEETLAKMPPFSDSKLVAGIRVTIEADAGAFPEGTTVEITAIEEEKNDEYADKVSDLVNGRVVEIQAVDITFRDADGNEIEPLIPIRVTMRPNNEAAEADGVEVVHVDSEGNVNAVTPDEDIAQPDQGAAFDTDSFSPYLLVYILKFDYPVNGKTYESELAGGESLMLSSLMEQLGACDEDQGLEFVSKIQTVTASDPEALMLTKDEEKQDWAVRPLKDSEEGLSLAIEMKDGAKFSVAVQATGKTEVTSEDNNTVITAVNDLYLPEGATTETAVLTEEQSTGAIAAVEKAVEEQGATETVAETADPVAMEEKTVSQAAYQVFSISLDNVEYSNYDGFQVSLTLPESITGKDFEIYHIDDEGKAQKLEMLDTDAHNLTDETQLVSTVSFVTPSFSEFVLRYTVDFHYKVNGNYYEFSFTGGSYVSLSQLLELLQIPYEPEPVLTPVAAASAVSEGETGIDDADISDNADGESVEASEIVADTAASADVTEPTGSDDSAESAAAEAKETRVVYNDLSSIVVSETTRDFVSRIKDVAFTNPDLIWVGKVEADTSVGTLKAEKNLAPEYSAELTEEQIAAIDAQPLYTGDWVLISLKPFQSEESLIITMNNDVVHKIRVTDVGEENYQYTVQINLDSSAKNLIAENENYYLYVHAVYGEEPNQIHRYGVSQFKIDDFEERSIQIDFPEWVEENGNQLNSNDTNTRFDGTEKSIEVKLLRFEGDFFRPHRYKYSEIVEEGQTIKAYKVNYVQDDSGSIHRVDNINLTTIEANNEYDYASILGPNMFYGIVADHLYHENHLQTNFAVNHYTGHGYDDRPDLSGDTSGGSIVIAQYNFQDPSKPNCVGDPVHVQNTAGQLFVGQNLNGTLVLFVDENSGSPNELSTNTGKVVGNLAQSVVIPTDGADLSANIVNPNLQYGINMSDTLAAKEATYDPPLPSESGQKLTLDTTPFDDDATIYINADRIKDYIASAGQLIIKKHPDQTIVFNFNEERRPGTNVTIGQFVVKQNGFPADGVKTESPEGRVGDAKTQNEYMDAIARHIVWNLNGVKGKTTINISAGIFLQPNYGSEIDVAGTSAGWIVSNGLVYNGSGEWHHVFSEMPDSTKVKLRAVKTVDGSVPKTDQVFDFTLEKFISKDHWEPVETVYNTAGSVDFAEIGNLESGWHVFRIKESGVNSGTTGQFEFDTSTYYAAVYVNEINGRLIASTPLYYSSFDEDAFSEGSSSVSLIGFSNESRVSVPTFENETKIEGLSISKRVIGTNDNTKEFKFEIKLWTENSGVRHQLKDESQFTIVGIPNVDTITFTNSVENDYSRAELILKSGQVATITDLPVGVHYEISEIMIGDKQVSNDNYVDGYKALTPAKSDFVDTDDMSRKYVFVNSYYAETSIQIIAQKVLQGFDRPLIEGEFTFELRENSPTGKVLGTVHNDADGKISFDVINYSINDMRKATVNAENGTREKVFTYYICELQNHENNAIAYPEPVKIEVKVIDDGKGHFTAYAEDGSQINSTYTLPSPDKEIINDKLTEISFTVTKDWTNAIGKKALAGHQITFSVTQNGTRFDLSMGNVAVSQTNTPNAENGSIEWAGNTVTLKAGTKNWPIVKIEHLPYFESGYVVTEISHTHDGENVLVDTQYCFEASGDESDEPPAIIRDNKDLLIKNKENNTLTINKFWVDDPSGRPEYVVVKLYRENNDGFDSTFNWPDSNCPYVIEGGVASTDYSNGPNSGKVAITLSADQNWTARILGLDRGSEDNPWRYYVEESVSGYTASITNNGAHSDGTIDITNTKDTTGIAVHKVWVDSSNNDNKPEITVNLMKADKVKDPNAVTVSYYLYCNDGSEAWMRRDFPPIEVLPNSEITITKDIFTGVKAGSGTATFDNNSKTWKISVSNQDFSIGLQTQWSDFNLGSINSQSAVIPVISEETDNGEPLATVLLNKENNWYYEWPSLPADVDFVYVIEALIGSETPQNAGYSVDYSDNNKTGIKTGTITIYNEKETSESGSIRLAKTVLVNNDAPTEVNRVLTNGDYVFTITGEASTATAGVEKTVKITFSDGVATQYQIDSETPVDLSGADRRVTVTDLIPGDYYVKETNPGNMTLAEITGGIVDISNQRTKVTVTADNTVDLPVDVVFTNNLEVESIAVWKVWKDIDGAYVSWPNNQSVTLALKQNSGSGTTGAEIARFEISKGAFGTPTVNARWSATEYQYIFEEDSKLISKGSAVTAVVCYKLGVSGLPTGYDYWFEEVAADGYYPIYSFYNVSQKVLNSNPSNQYATDGQYIVNHPENGYVLPNSGGPGTAMFGLIGGLMVGIAGAALLLRKKKNKA